MPDVKAPVVCGSCRHMDTDHDKDGKCEGVGCWCTKFWAEGEDGPEEGAGGHLSEGASNPPAQPKGTVPNANPVAEPEKPVREDPARAGMTRPTESRR